MATNTLGTTIQISATTITGATGKLAKVTKVGFPNPSQGVIDTTNHDSAGGIAEFVSDKIIKYKPFTVELQVTPGDTTDTACNTAAMAGVAYFVQINSNGVSATFKYNFSAIVTDYDIDDAPVNGIYTAKLSLQPTGAVTRA